MAICLHEGHETPRPLLLLVFQSSRQVKQKSWPQAPGEVKSDRNSKSAPEFTKRGDGQRADAEARSRVGDRFGGKVAAKVALHGPCVALTYDWIYEDVLADGALEIAALQHRLGGNNTARGCSRGKRVVGAHALMHGQVSEVVIIQRFLAGQKVAGQGCQALICSRNSHL